MINRDSLELISTYSKNSPELVNLSIVLNGGFGEAKRKEAVSALAHILGELEKHLVSHNPLTQRDHSDQLADRGEISSPSSS